ncbi:hypothetical protein J2S30_003744 [Herbaspirillum rubrisubalbicans]|uniref:hypothetical protein n=1 Tax=Herbaspirillum rubrisubalbicans TaxID=80842 RepID=UPI00209EF6DC|nr:hypothetical protein [Herbaspirillum rubrisubalbicans]MCP1575365.1 hypothetical protein [Herbaspirillum rubrisubalbicans]
MSTLQDIFDVLAQEGGNAHKKTITHGLETLGDEPADAAKALEDAIAGGHVTMDATGWIRLPKNGGQP